MTADAPPVPFAALLVMAGSGTRLGAAVPKAFVPLAGKPLWRHAAETIARVAGCRRLVLVAPAERVSEVASAAGDLGVAAVAVAGGERRQDSVRLGLAAAGDAGVILVHDAARPLVRAATLLEVAAEAAACGAAIAATPVRDTLKRVEADGTIAGTVDRASLWHAQTPQAFRRTILETAHAESVRRGLEVTDDAGLVEYLRLSPVRVVRSDAWNLKVTEPADLAAAAALLEERMTP